MKNPLDKKLTIIAELGNIHMSGFAVLMRAAAAFSAAGADMIKTQCIRPESAWWATTRQYYRYEKIEWQPNKWVGFFEKCKREAPVPVFPSIFDECYIHPLTSVVDYWKVGNKVTSMPRLMDTIINTEKPTIISFRDDQLELAKRYKDIPNVHTLYVQTKYPTHPEETRLPRFGAGYDGISYHGKDLAVLEGAVKLGAKIIEVHVQSKEAEGPDTEFALNLHEFRNLVEKIKPQVVSTQDT